MQLTFLCLFDEAAGRGQREKWLVLHGAVALNHFGGILRSCVRGFVARHSDVGWDPLDVNLYSLCEFVEFCMNHVN